jgi:hypothetical protein
VQTARSPPGGKGRERSRSHGRPPGKALAPTGDRCQRHNGSMDLERVSWLTTALACLLTAVILLLQGYVGYAGVSFAVAVSAAINLT